MFAGFNIKINDNDMSDLFVNNIPCEFLNEQKEAIKEECFIKKDEMKILFESIFDETDGTIDGTKVQNDWFPEIEADIFLSHSHKDIKLAKKLASWLDEKFGLKTFIDSNVWGYADDLLKKIDDEYCFKDGYYIYERRNLTTSHVHMMLNVALSKMIDKCECIFFLNTPNSIKLSESMKSQTSSAWIYSELILSKIIRKKTRKEHRQPFIIVQDSAEVNMNHDAPIDHLEEIDFDDLYNWSINKKCEKSRGCYNLDELYFQKGILKENS